MKQKGIDELGNLLLLIQPSRPGELPNRQLSNQDAVTDDIGIRQLIMMLAHPVLERHHRSAQCRPGDPMVGRVMHRDPEAVGAEPRKYVTVGPPQDDAVAYASEVPQRIAKGRVEHEPNPRRESAGLECENYPRSRVG